MHLIEMKMHVKWLQINFFKIIGNLNGLNKNEFNLNKFINSLIKNHF